MARYADIAGFGRWPWRERGFTLLELLVAITILSVIAAIVYASLAGVTDATELARLNAEKVRLRRYLRRQLTTLFSSAYADPGCIRGDYGFLGLNETGRNGPADAIEFCSSAPMIGGMSLPGALKRVSIEVADESVSDQTLGDLEPLGRDDGEESRPWSKLRVTERPLVLTSAIMPEGASGGAIEAVAEALSEADLAEFGFDTPSWAVPVHSMDITYFDGEEWIEEWDSLAIGRLPWSVRVRINFARTPEQLEEDQAQGLNIEENPDFDLLVTIPMGAGAMAEFIEQDARGRTEPRDGDRDTDNEAEDDRSHTAKPKSQQPEEGRS